MEYYNLYNLQSREITADEPVSLAEAKAYMKLEGFQDVGQSDSTVFDDDDTIIEDLIASARQTLEDKYAISIAQQTITVVLSNLSGNIQIPFGPIDPDSFEISDDSGVDLTDVKLVGTLYPLLKRPTCKDMTATYSAGYEAVPKKLKIEILRMVAWMFTNRGEEDNLKGFVYSSGEFNRNTWLA